MCELSERQQNCRQMTAYFPEPCATVGDDKGTVVQNWKFDVKRRDATPLDEM
jgi:hypothetical protein